MARELTTSEAKKFYDRFGAKQDTQAFYEDRAVDELIAHAGFEGARAVFELGCGTGRLAQRLLERHLASDCRYCGVDLSSTMVGLASERLRNWSDRAEVRPCDGSIPLAAADGGFDRFLSTYVLDLLGAEQIRAVIGEAHRILSPDGRLCLVSLTYGATPLSKLVTWGWQRIHALRPQLVGGCRPIELTEYLPVESWRIDHRAVVCAFGISSEVLVASRR